MQRPTCMCMPSGVCVACCLLHAVCCTLHRCRFHCRGAYCLVGLGTSAAGSDDGLNRLSSPAVVGAVRTRAACNMQHATCNRQHALCNVQQATHTIQQAACNVQGAACKVQHASESFIMHRASCIVQHAPGSMQETLGKQQQTARIVSGNKQHTWCLADLSCFVCSL